MDRSARVLVVDDDLPSRLIIAQTLRRAQCEIIEAEDGAAALARLGESPFDIIILDLRLPRVKGTDVIRALYADPTQAHMRLLVISAHADLDGIQLRTGDRFLLKPVTPQQLLEIVGAFLDAM
jgi:CheY-like chemotaxis protein